MRNIFFIFLITAITTHSVTAQKKYLAPEDAPSQIKEYAKKHFPNGKIAYVKKKEKLHYTQYKVKLNTLEELEFDGDFNIYEIESKHALPKSVIPKPIWQYVAKNYPNNTIREWKLKKNGRKVELDNDLDLLFDKNGLFLKID